MSKYEICFLGKKLFGQGISKQKFYTKKELEEKTGISYPVILKFTKTNVFSQFLKLLSIYLFDGIGLDPGEFLEMQVKELFEVKNYEHLQTDYKEASRWSRAERHFRKEGL